MNALQAFLRGGGTEADLLANYAIKAVRHREHGSLALYKYNQIASPFGDPIVQHARGVILDTADGFRIVARPFDKFFNLGEGHAAPIDWSTARVQEKVDGSLCVLYHYAGRWHVATTGMPDAGGNVNGADLTFAGLFWQVFREQGMPLPPDGAESLTFMFELTTPYNRIVVRHMDRRLTLLAVRNRETGEEMAPESFGFYPAVRSFPLQSFHDVIATFEHMDPVKQEGYVVVDARGQRVKVKHPGYVAIHHMRDGVCPRRIVEIVRSGETSELLTHFPEWRPDFDRIQGAFDSLCAEIDADFARLKDIETQKDFALRAVKTACSAALFQLRKGSIRSAREHLASIHVAKLMEMLRVADEPAQEAA